MDDQQTLPPGGGTTNEIFPLCQSLMQTDECTRLLFTTREPLPKPFNHRHGEITLGGLSREDAIDLVCEVMRREGLTPKHDDAGNTPQEIIDLVEAVNRHARALTLMAREISRNGVRATTGDLRRLMAELHVKHPGDRENSLYASVELSLRRSPAELREQLRALSVFHGGANIRVMGWILDQDYDAAKRLADSLIEVGLAEMMGYGHLRLDPALTNYLLGQMSATEQEEARTRWGEGIRGLAGWLYEQAFQDAHLASQLTLLELSNLLALLEWAQGALAPEEIVDLAVKLEIPLANLGRPQALAHAARAREQAARALGAWSPAHFNSLGLGVERMLEQGRLPEAQAAAEQLLNRTLAASDATYAGAAYDIALAHFIFGKALKATGTIEAALTPLRESQRRFQALADAGDTNAERMASVAISEAAECLNGLGRYDEAASSFEEGIRRAEKLGDRRGAAVNKGNLGTVRQYQKRYGEALESHHEALQIFSLLGEPGSVAAAWHMIGIVHREAGQFEQSEQAYRRSLAIRVQHQDRTGEASSLDELGLLYKRMGRLEEAVTFHQQAADIRARMQDEKGEGLSRHNLADALTRLQRYDEARRELRRAIDCKLPFGYAAELWKSWSNLHDLEQATGDAQAAEVARGQAIASYLAYRRAGGESQSNQAELFQAIQQGGTTKVEQTLAEWSKRELPMQLQTLAVKLQAILRGDHNPALAADPNLYYDNAAELQLLLEGLGAKREVGPDVE
jgi:tetratricopeptide (TPR) repeat protein